MVSDLLLLYEANPPDAAECDKFVTDGHFEKFQSLKAYEK